LRGNGHRVMLYTQLHENPEAEAEKGVLTGGGASAVAHV
jgi:hypothetical protein